MVPAGRSTPPTVVGTPRQAELRLERGLEPQRLLDEVRDEVALVAQLLLELGALADVPEHRAEQARRGLPPAANRFAAISMTSSTSGSEPSGNVAVASSVMTSLRGSRRRSSM